MKWLGYMVLGFLLTPLLFSVLVSFSQSPFLELPRDGVTLHWFRQFFANPVWVDALVNSLAIAVLTALLSVATALATAVALVRRAGAWKTVWEGAMLLPMVLPGVALAAGMLAVVRLSPLWGNPVSLVVAHSVVAVPVAYLVLRASLAKADPDLIAAACGLGAGPWQVFRFITLPLAAPAIFAATLLSLVVSLNEVTVTLFLATRDIQTLPRVIWPNLRFAITPLVAAASVVLLGLTLPAVLAAVWWLRPSWSARKH